jgi:hypothetical protein
MVQFTRSSEDISPKKMIIEFKFIEKSDIDKGILFVQQILSNFDDVELKLAVVCSIIECAK